MHIAQIPENEPEPIVLQWGLDIRNLFDPDWDLENPAHQKAYVSTAWGESDSDEEANDKRRIALVTSLDIEVRPST